MRIAAEAYTRLRRAAPRFAARPVQRRVRAVRCQAYHPPPVSVLLASENLLRPPLATAEFLAVDTETNGLARERCELTEVGAVLVGGGELHERWSSLVGISAPLSRGIQRFTGISQAMVDGAPPPEAVLPELGRLLRGRVLVAHSARFDLGVLRGAFARAALDWPEPPVLCTVAMARRLAPLQRRRGLAALADALGIEVEVTHRALPDAETCARVFCALFSRLTAHAATIGEAVALLGPSRRSGAGRRPRAGARRRPPAERPDFSALPRDPGVYVFRDADGHPLYVGKSVCLRTRARAHFTTPAEWTGQAEHVDYQATRSELGALLLEDRLIKTLRPPGNTRGKRHADGYVYLRCRLDIPFPILEVALEPAAGHAVTVGPVRGRAAAAELVEQLNSLFGLRHCGRRLPRREHPSAYGQMGRCLSPCLGDLDPNLYRERLDGALRLFVDSRDGGARAARPHRRPDPRGRGRAQLRARGVAAAPARAPGGARAAARRPAAGHAHRRAARARAAPRADAAASTRSGSRAGAWSTGVRCRRIRRSCRRAPPPRCARCRAASWAAGCPPRSWPRSRLVGAWVAAHDPPWIELDAGVLEHGRLARWIRSVESRV